ncbi:hypothetical protein K458DRAFT_423881 [Lentithecium fluviatile CBS 122367]|uniref:Uncharacterized protein n=1 Tax=Lentithecium fluviatile CBS 122367 TaxID=1168545 RepID=A0A6G1II91_9PLEO|nr:hypothetical protein K458DRAFT_423881 [Lentithecium fluviatile CBS 122367]
MCLPGLAQGPNKVMNILMVAQHLSQRPPNPTSAHPRQRPHTLKPTPDLSPDPHPNATAQPIRPTTICQTPKYPVDKSSPHVPYPNTFGHLSTHSPQHIIVRPKIR